MIVDKANTEDSLSLLNLEAKVGQKHNAFKIDLLRCVAQSQMFSVAQRIQSRPLLSASSRAYNKKPLRAPDFKGKADYSEAP